MPFIIGPRAPVTTAAEVAAVVADARSQSCRVARLAIESLRNAPNHPPATRALLDGLASPACAIRASAAYSLVRHRDDAIGPAVTELLHDQDRRVRQAAAYALGSHPHAAANPILVRLLQDPSKHVRLAAVEALGRSGDRSVSEEIATLTSDPEPHVRQAVHEAMARLAR
jgi:HEAT repeat protein